MSRLSLFLMIVVGLVSFAQIAPARRRHPSQRDPSANSGNNLVVEVSERALNAGIRPIRSWLADQLHHTNRLPHFEKTMRILKTKMHNIQVNTVDLGDFALKVGTDGSADLLFPNVNLVCESEWNYTAGVTKDQGTLTANIKDITLDLRHLVPKAFAGIPFINPDVDCHAIVDSVAIRVEGDRTISLFNMARPFIEAYFRKEISKMLCYEAVHVLDEFLRDGVERLSLRHLIYGSHILNYALVADPRFIGSSLVLKHAGQIDEETAQSHFSHRHRSEDDWMFKYSIHPDLINQMLVVLANASAFDTNFTVSNSDDTKIQLFLTTAQPPTITIRDETATLNIVSQWNVRIGENEEGALSTIYSEDFALNTTYDNNAQLKFRLGLTQSNEQQPSDEVEKKRAIDSRNLFLNAVHRHYSTIIGRFLRLPLPKFEDTTVTDGHVGFVNGFLLFGADFAPVEDDTVAASEEYE